MSCWAAVGVLEDGSVVWFSESCLICLSDDDEEERRDLARSIWDSYIRRGQIEVVRTQVCSRSRMKSLRSLIHSSFNWLV